MNTVIISKCIIDKADAVLRQLKREYPKTGLRVIMDANSPFCSIVQSGNLIAERKIKEIQKRAFELYIGGQ